MRNLRLLMVMVISTHFFAQTITETSHKPQVGNSYIANDVVGTVNNSSTGSGVTFNNSSLTAGASATVNFVMPSSTEISTYPGSNLKQTSGNGNDLLFKSSTGKLEITALITSQGTFNFNANNGTYLVYPASFGTTSTDNAQGTFTSAAASGLFRGSITITGDATGTLLIGTKTFNNVLRIKIVQDYNLHAPTDTNFLFAIGTFDSTSYLYYDLNNKFPLLNDNSATIIAALAGINQTINFAQALNVAFLGNKEVKSNEDFIFYPNPSNDIVTIKGDLKGYDTATLYDVEGKTILKSNLKENFISITGIPSGNYILVITGANKETIKQKIIKK